MKRTKPREIRARSLQRYVRAYDVAYFIAKNYFVNYLSRYHQTPPFSFLQ